MRGFSVGESPSAGCTTTLPRLTELEMVTSTIYISKAYDSALERSLRGDHGVTEKAAMEFGIFIQGYLPGRDAHVPIKEHEAFKREAELVECADRNNWKYVWISEHHGLTEYSHMSSNEVMLGYLAGRTTRIHLGSG